MFTVLGNVAHTITAVAVILLLLAVTSKVTWTVALVAFFPWTPTASEAWTASHGALSGEVAHAVTLVTLGT